jgi:hypothetical protein
MVDLAAVAPHPALCVPILPRCLNTREFRLQAGGIQEDDHISIEFRVMVQDGTTIPTSLGNASGDCCTTHSAVG